MRTPREVTAGGNGGGGLVAARRLLAAGARVQVCLARPVETLAAVPRAQHGILEQIGVDVVSETSALGEPELVIDALLGYGQRGDPRGRFAELVRWTHDRRVLALDVPTGLLLDEGSVATPAVRAEATLTLALPKRGLRAPGAPALTGDIYLGDISIPSLIYDRLGIRSPSPFGEGPIVRVAPTTT